MLIDTEISTRTLTSDFLWYLEESTYQKQVDRWQKQKTSHKGMKKQPKWKQGGWPVIFQAQGLVHNGYSMDEN